MAEQAAAGIQRLYDLRVFNIYKCTLKTAYMIRSCRCSQRRDPEAVSKQKIETLRGKLFIKECFIGSIVRHHKCLTKAQSAERSVDLGKATSLKVREPMKVGTEI